MCIDYFASWSNASVEVDDHSRTLLSRIKELFSISNFRVSEIFIALEKLIMFVRNFLTLHVQAVANLVLVAFAFEDSFFSSASMLQNHLHLRKVVVKISYDISHLFRIYKKT